MLGHTSSHPTKKVLAPFVAHVWHVVCWSGGPAAAGGAPEEHDGCWAGAGPGAAHVETSGHASAGWPWCLRPQGTLWRSALRPSAIQLFFLFLTCSLVSFICFRVSRAYLTLMGFWWETMHAEIKNPLGWSPGCERYPVSKLSARQNTVLHAEPAAKTFVCLSGYFLSSSDSFGPQPSELSQRHNINHQLTRSQNGIRNLKKKEKRWMGVESDSKTHVIQSTYRTCDHIAN